jgi:hypothetical protein
MVHNENRAVVTVGDDLGGLEGPGHHVRVVLVPRECAGKSIDGDQPIGAILDDSRQALPSAVSKVPNLLRESSHSQKLGRKARPPVLPLHSVLEAAWRVL